MALRLRGALGRFFRRRRAHAPDEMSLVEHLAELRTRLIVSVAAIALGSIPAWFLFDRVLAVMTDPFCSFMAAHPELAINPARPCKLVYHTVTEAFLLRLKVTFFLGLLLALPVVLYQLWAFVTPGLTQRERRFALPFVLASLALFAMGGLFAILTLPRALAFLLGFAGTDQVAAVLSIGKYIGFVMVLILAFGASFEFPLLLISLTYVGVLSTDQLRAWRRYAVLGIAVFAAFITPSADLFTMMAMMLPLLVFYELSILISRFLKR